MSYDGDSAKGLVLAKKSVARLLARIPDIPIDTYVNDEFMMMQYIDMIKNYLEMPKLKLWDVIKKELRIEGYHKRIDRMQDLYQTIALAESYKLFKDIAKDVTHTEQNEKIAEDITHPEEE